MLNLLKILCVKNLILTENFFFLYTFIQIQDKSTWIYLADPIRDKWHKGGAVMVVGSGTECLIMGLKSWKWIVVIY